MISSAGYTRWASQSLIDDRSSHRQAALAELCCLMTQASNFEGYTMFWTSQNAVHVYDIVLVSFQRDVHFSIIAPRRMRCMYHYFDKVYTAYIFYTFLCACGQLHLCSVRELQDVAIAIQYMYTQCWRLCTPIELSLTLRHDFVWSSDDHWC